MLKQLKKQTTGFTIIEVMIVLAIAGLILLIVFLAVPALQRNSRNTQRRNDVTKILAAIQEYTNNNNGTLPLTSGQFSAAAQFGTAAPKTGFYDMTTATNVTWGYSAASQSPASDALTVTDTVKVYNYAKCNGGVAAAAGSGQISRSVIALFNVEGTGTGINQCVES